MNVGGVLTKAHISCHHGLAASSEGAFSQLVARNVDIKEVHLSICGGNGASGVDQHMRVVQFASLLALREAKKKHECEMTVHPFPTYTLSTHHHSPTFSWNPPSDSHSLNSAASLQ